MKPHSMFAKMLVAMIHVQNLDHHTIQAFVESPEAIDVLNDENVNNITKQEIGWVAPSESLQEIQNRILTLIVMFANAEFVANIWDRANAAIDWEQYRKLFVENRLNADHVRKYFWRQIIQERHQGWHQDLTFWNVVYEFDKVHEIVSEHGGNGNPNCYSTILQASSPTTKKVEEHAFGPYIYMGSPGKNGDISLIVWKRNLRKLKFQDSPR